MVEYKAHIPFKRVAMAGKAPPAQPANASAAPASPAAAAAEPAPTAAGEAKPAPAAPARKPEIGGPKGPEPTRYGDWEKGGRCIDF